jgi:hypothetical protein
MLMTVSVDDGRVFRKFGGLTPGLVDRPAEDLHAP